MKRDRIRGQTFFATIVAMFLVVFVFLASAGHVQAADTNAVKPQEVPSLAPEITVIEQAAKINHCTTDDTHILFAIRLTENGATGREFGIMADRAINTNLETQARWAAATIVKNRIRWENDGKPGNFIEYLGNRYSPPADNPNWVRNVKFWYAKFTPISSSG